MEFSGEKACATTDPEVFYPIGEDKPEARQRVWEREAIKAAKAICGFCEVKTECLNYALENGEEFGIWGGMTTYERKALLRRNSRNRYAG